MRRRIRFDECDETEEVCGWLNKIRADQDQIEAKVIQNSNRLDELEKKKAKSKKKGSALVKTLVSIVLLLVIAGLCYGAYVPTDINYDIASNPDLLATYLRDCFGNITSNSFLFTPTDTAPTATEGTVYYGDAGDALLLRTSSTWVTLEAGTGNSLDSAYNLGNTIDVDGTAVTLTTSDNDNNIVLAIVQNEATNDNAAATITMGTGATGSALTINSQTSGTDITGDNWNVAQTGAFTLVGIDTTGNITLENDEVLKNDNNGEIELGNGTEDTAFAWGTDEVQLSSDTGVVTINFGDVDAFTGVSTITGDATDFTLQITADAGGEDLLIQQAGGVDASLDLRSAGTGADAIKMVASAGGLDIDAVDDINITVASSTTADDFVIAQTGANNSSILVQAAGTGTDAISLQASAGGIDIDAVDDVIITVASTTTADDLALVQTGAVNASITMAAAGTGDDAIDLNASAGGVDIDGVKSVTITSTENTTDAIVINATVGGINISADGAAATEDITITSTGSSTIITATENVQNAVHLESNGGTSESINLYANQGSGASATTEHDASIQLQSDAGGISLYTTGNVADAVRIETNGGTSETIIINNLQGTGTDAVTISANAAGGDVDINSVLGSIFIEAEENSATAISIISDGGTTSGIWIQNDTGTSVTEDTASVEIRSDVGGINIQSDANLDDAIMIRVDGGTTSEMTIHNDTGNTADSIELISDAGGITLNGAVGGVVFTAGQTKSVIFMVTDVELDSANPPGTTSIGTAGQAEFDTLGFDSNPNAGGDDICYINWIVPAGYIVDSGDLHVYWTFSTAEDAADECDIDGTVQATAPGEAIDTAGTAMTAVTSVIADASADNGKLVKTSLDIEVEDIAVGDLVTIMFFFDESACLMAASGTADVHYFEITYESSE